METLELLQITWFVLIGVLLIGYSILDGFDLGIGVLLPILAKKDEEKKSLFNAIGPFWDGNEVWLITGGAAMFSAFPQAYATVFSGFYLAFVLVLFSLIFRAVSLEFWGLDEERRGLWEWSFTIGSFFPSLLYGVALGNVISGIPLDQGMEYKGGFFTLLTPFPLSLGLLGLAMILMQGTTFSAMKLAGEIQERARRIAFRLQMVYIGLLLLSFVLACIYIPGTISNTVAWICLLVILVSWFGIRFFLNEGKDTIAFYMSSLAFLGLWGIVGSIHFPNLVRASNNPQLSLTIYNASSSALTLKVMLVIALIGLPIVIGYTIYVYRIFKGKIGSQDIG